MLAHSNGFKEELTQFGRQYKNIIGIYDSLLLSTEDDINIITQNDLEIIAKVSNENVAYEIDDTNIYYIKLVTKGELLSTLMKELDFESDINLDVGSVIDYKFGLLVNGNYEYLNYGKYIIHKKEYQNDTKTYVYTCYDFMLKTMLKISDEFRFTGNPTGDDIMHKVCETLGIEFDDSLVEQGSTKPTPYGMIKNLMYRINIATIKEANITYRDLLNLLCQYFGVSMYMNNNELKIKLLGDITDTGEIDNNDPTPVDTIDKSFFADKNVTFKEIYGKINALTISGTDETKNKYVEDTSSVAENGLTLFEVKNNLIFNDTDIWETYSTQIADNIFYLIDNVNFNLCDFSTYGIMYLEWLDYFDVIIDSKEYRCLLLNSEITIKNGMKEDIYTDLPEKNVNEYTTTPKSDDIIANVIRARGNAYANGYKLVQENEINVYSTDEIKIGTWIDGKTIYRKVIQYSNTLTGGKNDILHGIDNIDKIINIHGLIPFINYYYFFGSYIDDTQFISISSFDTTHITIYIGSAWSNSFKNGAILILEYTKTTD